MCHGKCGDGDRKLPQESGRTGARAAPGAARAEPPSLGWVSSPWPHLPRQRQETTEPPPQATFSFPKTEEQEEYKTELSWDSTTPKSKEKPIFV